MIEKVVETWPRFLAGELPEALDCLLADDVVFYSPIVYAPQRGKDVATIYLHAAAQTLPRGTTERPLLIFVAFAVAVGSLMLQGFTLPWLVRMLRFEHAGDDSLEKAEQESLAEELRDAASAAVAGSNLVRQDGTPFPQEIIDLIGARLFQPPDVDQAATAQDMLELRLALIGAMRVKLNTLSSGGAYSTAIFLSHKPTGRRPNSR